VLPKDFKALNRTGALILNTGLTTRIVPPGQNKSCPNISIVSSNLALRASWNTIEDTGNSDHLPTVCMLEGAQCRLNDVNNTQIGLNTDNNVIRWLAAGNSVRMQFLKQQKKSEKESASQDGGTHNVKRLQATEELCPTKIYKEAK